MCNRPSGARPTRTDALISNYLEKVVREIVQRRPDCAALDQALREDVMCLALNQLPTRYYRNEQKMERFLSEAERQEMEMAAQAAVEGAMDYLSYVEASHAGFAGRTG